MVEKYARCAGIPKKINCHGLYYTCTSHSSVFGMIGFYPNTPLRKERMRTQKKDMPPRLERVREGFPGRLT